MPLGGGPPTTLASGQAQPFDIAVDATSVYWLSNATQSNYDPGQGTVMKLSPK
jgi:hypothetical protein